MMKRFGALAVLLCVAVLVGCGKKEDASNKEEDNENKSSETKVSLKNDACCLGCGEKAESEKCCAEDAKKCACGFNDGSDLCCSGLTPKAGAKLCKCGHEAKTESCCAEDAKICEKCNYHAGSAGCKAKCSSAKK